MTSVNAELFHREQDENEKRVWNCTECWAVLTVAEMDDHECVEQPHEGNTSPQSSNDGSNK
jgi:hypothetical protein